MNKLPVRSIGSPCRHCGKAVERKEHKPDWRPRPDRIWYRWWLKCPNCKAIYFQKGTEVYPASHVLSGRNNISPTDDQPALDYANDLYEQDRSLFS